MWASIISPIFQWSIYFETLLGRFMFCLVVIKSSELKLPVESFFQILMMLLPVARKKSPIVLIQRHVILMCKSIHQASYHCKEVVLIVWSCIPYFFSFNQWRINVWLIEILITSEVNSETSKEITGWLWPVKVSIILKSQAVTIYIVLQFEIAINFSKLILNYLYLRK